MLAWLAAGSTGAEIESLALSVKKATVLGESENPIFIDLLRQQAIIHGGRISPERLKLLNLPSRDLARTLLSEEQLGFDQNSIGKLFGRDKATISRWVNKNRKPNTHRG